MSTTAVHDDPLNDLFNAPAIPATERRQPPASYTPPDYTEPCSSCRGSGRFVRGRFVGQCFKCKGKGKITRKTSPERRAANQASTAARRVRTQAENVEGFKANHTDLWTWIEAKWSSFNFAQAMKEAVEKYGSLTDGQMATSTRLMQADQTRALVRQERIANAQTINIEPIAQAFATASSNGLKRPKLRMAGFQFSPAPAHGTNAGAIYVKGLADDLYLGKVVAGRFIPSRDCTPEMEAKVIAAAGNPLEAAVSYGRLSGSCSCCGRTLTDPESVARGIGPICAANFGW